MATTATSVSSVTSTQAPAANDFTDEPSVSDQLSCSLDNPDGCLMCGS